MAKYFARPEDFNDLPYLIRDQEENAGTFETWLNAEETKILKKIFGLPMYNDLQAAWTSDPDLASGIWYDLSVGAEYSYGDLTYEYKGLRAFLVPYLYSLWVQIELKKFTHSGFATAVQDQNQLVNGWDAIAKAYNDFVDQVCGECDEIENTLYGFLVANEDDYGSDWLAYYEAPEYMNSFGI